MGIHGNATAVLNFDNAQGYLIGKVNEGLKCMFTFMNLARLGTAQQGVAGAERSFQGALAYAKERLAMRGLNGPEKPELPADPIIVHPDVRRMLLTQKSVAEGGRALVYYCAFLSDRIADPISKEDAAEAQDLLSFLTPIAKAFLTEMGLESANHGMQILGGHGFIAEHGMEQIVRDTRIATLYEGTTGIQALDLLGRKVLMSQGEALKKFTKVIHKFCQANKDNDDMKEFVEPLSALNSEWGELTMQVGAKAMQNRNEVGAASVDYLMYSGYVTLGYFWALMAKTAQQKLSEGTTEKDFYNAKVKTARFYFAKLLPRSAGHKATMLTGAESLMDLDQDHFAF